MDKLYLSFFILCVALGSKAEDIFNMLRGAKDTPLTLLDDGSICIDIDETLFAKKIDSEILENSSKCLTVMLPKLMLMLIADIKQKFNTLEIDNEFFLMDYKTFIEKSAKNKFQKTISIKVKQSHRYFARFIKSKNGDLFTALFATGVIARKDTAKLAYTSTRTEATGHSQLLLLWWNTLELDSITSRLLGINENLFKTIDSTIAQLKFSGSGKIVDSHKAQQFFHIIHSNLYKYNTESEEYFNLVSMYIRYAMTFLLGTRDFLASANFNSYSSVLGLWSIIEKSQDDASGIRIVPVCKIMKNLLALYQQLLLQHGIKDKDIYLIIDSQYIGYKEEKARNILSQITGFTQKQKDVLIQFVDFAPLNSGRHLLTQKAIDDSISTHYIDAYLGHYAAGEEPLGMYSTLDVAEYIKAINHTTTKIASMYGIKEL